MSSRFSIVIVNYGTPELVRGLLDSLNHHPDRALVDQCVVVDNGHPAAGDCRTVIEPSRYTLPVRFVQNPAASYSSGVNRGAQSCAGDYIAVLNSDIVWTAQSALVPILETCEARPDIGIAGPQLVFPDGRWQRSHGCFPSVAEAVRAIGLLDVLRNALAAARFQTALHQRRPRAVDYVDGAFMVVRRSCFEAVGGFDEQYPFYAEDADFCWRARRLAWRTVFVPQARATHLRGASSTSVRSGEFVRMMFAAKVRFVERTAGSRSAARYARLWSVAARVLAVVYRGIAGVRRSPEWRQRAASAQIAAQAAASLGGPAPSAGGGP